jgi:hypothetical protein
MYIEEAAIKIYQDLFAVPPHGGYRTAYERADGPAMTAASDAARGQCDSFDPPADKVRSNGADNGFDFGKFRQSCSESSVAY